MHVMIGGIDASNAASLRLHKNLGFEQVAEFRQVGRKFGRWLDLVFVQRFVDR
jgi:phosphinothricin acetyltransferase